MYIGLADSLDPEIATHPSYHIPSPPSFSRCCRCLLAGVHILCLWAQAILPRKKQHKQGDEWKTPAQTLTKEFKPDTESHRFTSFVLMFVLHSLSQRPFHWIKLNHWRANITKFCIWLIDICTNSRKTSTASPLDSCSLLCRASRSTWFNWIPMATYWTYCSTSKV